MSEWPVVALRNIARIVDCEHKTAPAAKPGEEFGYSVGTPTIRNGRIDYATAKRVSRQTFAAWSRRAVLCEGDLILAREAPVGQVGLVDSSLPTCLGQRTVLVRPASDKIVSRYLHGYLLGRDAQAWMADRSAGSTVAHINVADVREIPVVVPPLEEQRRIALILSSFDDLIETDRSQIFILEELARTIANQSEHIVPLAQFAAVVAPKQVRPFGTVEYYSLPAFDERSVPEIVDGSVIQSNKLPLNEPCVLISRLNPKWARCWMVYPGTNAVASTEFVPLIGIGAAPEEVWAVTSASPFWQQMRSHVTGTTGSHQRVDKAAVPALGVPDVRTLSYRARNQVENLVRAAQAIRGEIDDLMRTRDELLPLLMSGKVRVSEDLAVT